MRSLHNNQNRNDTSKRSLDRSKSRDLNKSKNNLSIRIEDGENRDELEKEDQFVLFRKGV